MNRYMYMLGQTTHTKPGKASHTYIHCRHVYTCIYMYLVLMARSLTVLGQCYQTLIDESCIVGVDVEAEQHETSGTDSTYGV